MYLPRPKGVMASFKAWTASCRGVRDILHVNHRDRYLSYLPLAHVADRWAGQGLALVSGMRIFFAESLTTFLADLNRARPTLFISVPRLWTKFQLGVYSKVDPDKLNFLLKIPLVNRLVRKKILSSMGLDCVRYAGTGSAPTPPALFAWYRSLGLELLEGYGMVGLLYQLFISLILYTLKGTLLTHCFFDTTRRRTSHIVTAPGLVNGDRVMLGILTTV